MRDPRCTIALAGLLAAGCGDDGATQNANLPPSIEAPAALAAEEGKQLVIALNASDPEGERLDLTAAKPEGSLFDPQGKLFTWTPGFDAARTEPYVVAFTAFDGLQSVSVTTAIVV